jgi:Fe-S cluster biogenesis protein NfuA
MNASETDERPPSARLELIERIKEILEQEVRPEFTTQNSGVVLAGVGQDNIAQVRLTGARRACSWSAAILCARIEAVLKARISEIRLVEAVR